MVRAPLFSVVFAADQLHAVFGTMISAVFVEYANYRWIFWFTTIIAVPAAVFCLFLIPNHDDKPSSATAGSRLAGLKKLDLVGVSVLTGVFLSDSCSGLILTDGLTYLSRADSVHIRYHERIRLRLGVGGGTRTSHHLHLPHRRVLPLGEEHAYRGRCRVSLPLPEPFVCTANIAAFQSSSHMVPPELLCPLRSLPPALLLVDDRLRRLLPSLAAGIRMVRDRVRPPHVSPPSPLPYYYD